MKLIRAVLATLIISTPIFFSVNAYSTTPEINFDMWVQEIHDFQDSLLKASVAEEWGKAGWSEAVEVELAHQAAVAAEQARTRTSTSTTSTIRTSGGGSISQGQLEALANCEGSGVNGWRTGYFGIEAGYPIGDESWDQQVAWVNQIYRDSGADAWGVLCRPILGG